jgi:uncharacterized secreted repeat protein (TIGR03808 family)
MRVEFSNKAYLPAKGCPHLSRRSLLVQAALGFAAAMEAARAQTQPLIGALREAQRRGRPLQLPPGVTHLQSLELPSGARLLGAPEGSTLRLVGAGPLLYAKGARDITIESVTFEGSGAAARARGLLEFEDVAKLSIRGCALRHSSANGLRLLRCGGVLAQNRIENMREAAIFSLDGQGFDIDGNTILDCGDNGVLVWTSSPGAHAGSRVRNNRIEDIGNFSGGDGPNGNGVGVFRAGSVRVENNRIRRCAYTAVRNNAGSDVEVIGNDCKSLGERAMYAEFGAKRAIFRDNRIEDAGAGISITNARDGTDGGAATGNTIVGLFERHPDPAFGPSMFWQTGIAGERNCDISGNTVVGPAWIGVMLAGPRDNVSVEGNRVVGADFGIGFLAGRALGESRIIRNRIEGARKAAIAAFDGPNPLPGDILSPAGASRSVRGMRIEGNETR